MVIPRKDRCTKSVSDPTGFGRGQCSRRGVVTRDDRLYCKQHDPVAVHKKDKKKSAELKAKYAYQREERERAAACSAACEGVPVSMLQSGMVMKLVTDAVKVKMLHAGLPKCENGQVIVPGMTVWVLDGSPLKSMALLADEVGPTYIRTYSEEGSSTTIGPFYSTYQAAQETADHLNKG